MMNAKKYDESLLPTLLLNDSRTGDVNEHGGYLRNSSSSYIVTNDGYKLWGHVHPTSSE